MLICINGHQNLPITAQSVASGVRMIEFCHECGARVTESCPVCGGLHPLNAVICPIIQINIQRFKAAKNDAHERLRLFLASRRVRDIYKRRRQQAKQDGFIALGLLLFVVLAMFVSMKWNSVPVFLLSLAAAIGCFCFFIRAVFARDGYLAVIEEIWGQENMEILDTVFQQDLPWPTFTITDANIRRLLQ